VRVSSVNGQVAISDRAAAHWLLGLFLLAGGVLATSAAAGLVANADNLQAWERGMALVIGVGGSAGAVWWLRRSPSTRVTLDLSSRRMRVRRLGLFGRQVEEFDLEQVANVVVERAHDDEGGDVSRPVVHLKSGETVLLSRLWSHDRRGVIAAAAAVADACHLSRPTG
jgi:hypothetical protein